MKHSSKTRLRSRRGNAMLEFGLASLILIPLFVGTFQFGYTFYVYNLLSNQVRAGARYASMRTFRCKDDDGITAFKNKVKNVVVYGNPAPAGGATSLVPGLTTARVDVQIKGQNDLDASKTNIPAYVTVSSLNFPLDAVFRTYTFNGKPVLRFPYSGQYAPGESE